MLLLLQARKDCMKKLSGAGLASAFWQSALKSRVSVEKRVVSPLQARSIFLGMLFGVSRKAVYGFYGELSTDERTVTGVPR